MCPPTSLKLTVSIKLNIDGLQINSLTAPVPVKKIIGLKKFVENELPLGEGKLGKTISEKLRTENTISSTEA